MFRQNFFPGNNNKICNKCRCICSLSSPLNGNTLYLILHKVNKNTEKNLQFF